MFKLRSALMLLVLLTAAFYYTRAQATCPDGGSGDDNIICDTHTLSDGDILGGGGNDTIYIGENVNTILTASGDNNFSAGSGNDAITNEGKVGRIVGDNIGGSSSQIATGNDTLINNGTVITAMSGDAYVLRGSGNDYLENNGQVDGVMLGDSLVQMGSGNDTIINNGAVNSTTASTTNLGIVGDSASGTGSGNDLIINNGYTVAITGDSHDNQGSGSDTIINNNTVAGDIVGDSTNGRGGYNPAPNWTGGSGGGHDTITNNGSVNNIYGDSANQGDYYYQDTVNNQFYLNIAGNDTILNTGTVSGDIVGDSGAVVTSQEFAGQDTIENTGIVEGSIYGDTRGSIGSDDLITNTGTVETDIYGSGGNDTIVNCGIVEGIIDGGTGNDQITQCGTVYGNIVAGAGNDAVNTDGGTVYGNISLDEGDDWINVEGGTVNGIIDGGAGTDTLYVYTYTFEAEDFFIPAEYEAIRQQLLASNTSNCPCTITFVVDGRTFTYTHTNFENLDAALRFIKLTFTPYDEINCQNGVKCFALKTRGFRTGNVQIYASENGQGVQITTLNFNTLGAGGYSYTNPDNGWTVEVAYTGSEGDARLYSVTIRNGADVRNASTQIMSFSFADQNPDTNALAWR